MFDFNLQEMHESRGGAEATRVLSVSGGGLLGVIPAAMLMRLETLGKVAYGEDYRLAHSFDMVGGSSTGAVIATGIALGLTAGEIADFYLKDVPIGFRRKPFAIPGIHDVMDGDLMQSMFLRRTNGRRLVSGELETDLCISAKDVGRNRALLFTSRPGTGMTVPGADIHRDDLPLDLLLRASTAVPGLFSPVNLPLASKGQTPCIDGGLGPHNNPAMPLFALACQDGTGPIDMLSLGTGAARRHKNAARISGKPAWQRMIRGLTSIVKECEDFSDDWIRHLVSLRSGTDMYRRINMAIDAETFQLLGCSATARDLRMMRRFADPRGKARLFEVASRYAELALSDPLPLARKRGGVGLVDSKVASRPTRENSKCFKA